MTVDGCHRLLAQLYFTAAAAAAAVLREMDDAAELSCYQNS